MDKIDIFQARFGKVDYFYGGIWSDTKLTLSHSLLPRIFKKEFT